MYMHVCDYYCHYYCYYTYVCVCHYSISTLFLIEAFLCIRCAVLFLCIRCAVLLNIDATSSMVVHSDTRSKSFKGLLPARRVESISDSDLTMPWTRGNPCPKGKPRDNKPRSKAKRREAKQIDRITKVKQMDRKSTSPITSRADYK